MCFEAVFARMTEPEADSSATVSAGGLAHLAGFEPSPSVVLWVCSVGKDLWEEGKEGDVTRKRGLNHTDLPPGSKLRQWGIS